MTTEKFETKREIEQVMRKVLENPVCIICGEQDPRVIQRHHLLGRRVSDVTGPLCANCHAKITSGQNYLVNKSKTWKSDSPAYAFYTYAALCKALADKALNYFRRGGFGG